MQYIQITPTSKKPLSRIAVPAKNRSIEILRVKPITSQGLIRYLEEMKISLSIASKYLTEIEYRVWSAKISDYKIYHCLGFRNDLLGYELSHKFYRGATLKHYTTLPGTDHSRLNIFPGVFDFLSALELSKVTSLKYDTLILNNPVQMENTVHLVKNYKLLNIFVNNDAAGIETVNFYRKHHPRVRDFSVILYPFPFTDINEMLIKTKAC